jgi:hypothetical protein
MTLEKINVFYKNHQHYIEKIHAGTPSSVPGPMGHGTPIDFWGAVLNLCSGSVPGLNE